MAAKSLIYFHLFYCLCTCNQLGDLDENFVPDYETIKYVTQHADLRSNFLRKKVQEKKMKMIDRTTSTVYVDGITHFESGHLSLEDKAEQFESEFKQLLGMKEFKYIYRRDENWRTWREIDGASGEKKFISYRCQNNANSSACGFWAVGRKNDDVTENDNLCDSDCDDEEDGVSVKTEKIQRSSVSNQHYKDLIQKVTRVVTIVKKVIEDNTPPCPYEIFSIKDSLELCGAKFSQFTQELGDCPAVIKFGELTSKCNNPIETRWRFTRIYNKETEKASQANHLICGGKGFCELTSLYDISPQHVVFRLINSSNDIIYSRVMKPDRQNFFCVESCGKMNPNNMKVTANDAPMSLNLFELNKKKREDKKHVNFKTKGKPRKITTITPAEIKRIVMFQANKIVEHNVALPLKRTTTPMPMLPWLKIRRTNLDFYDDNFLEGDYVKN